MTCQSCSSQMKLLFSSFYCPNDCDRKKTSDLDTIELWTQSAEWLCFGGLLASVDGVSEITVPKMYDGRYEFWSEHNRICETDLKMTFRKEDVVPSRGRFFAVNSGTKVLSIEKVPL